MPHRDYARIHLSKKERIGLLEGVPLDQIKSFHDAFDKFALSKVPMKIDFVCESVNKMYFIVNYDDNPFDLELTELSDYGFAILFKMKVLYFERTIFQPQKETIQVPNTGTEN